MNSNESDTHTRTHIPRYALGSPFFFFLLFADVFFFSCFLYKKNRRNWWLQWTFNDDDDVDGNDVNNENDVEKTARTKLGAKIPKHTHTQQIDYINRIKLKTHAHTHTHSHHKSIHKSHGTKCEWTKKLCIFLLVLSGFIMIFYSYKIYVHLIQHHVKHHPEKTNERNKKKNKHTHSDRWMERIRGDSL